ncbi:aldose epimerase [Merismopedia glauca]|uniref:Aldose epimerase n=1 Tax=Merismopedia glauca CCAP 1448/3 TaxID=1296344 RepID=A0A2T1C8J8_9CYAN|nr:aldose epimerase [Merismopedia glauca]PSB04467.1 aldose epimerase [Merismopedia glauca CCAP 1448/3]
MFAIAHHQEQYKIYSLSDTASDSWLEVVPERGGIITKWGVNGQELLYLDTERFTHPELSVRGGIPILFPICGNLPNNVYTHQEQEYTLKQHGFARDLPWSVISQETGDIASISLQLTSNEETKQVYPFEFTLVFTYQLIGNTVKILQSYTNHSSEPMLFSAGLHPYFAVNDKSQLEFAIPASEYTDQRTREIFAYRNHLDLDREELDLAFGYMAANFARVTDNQTQRQLYLQFAPDFNTVVFWTLKDKPFYCIEPWTAGRNALNTGDRIIKLAPNTTLETWVELQSLQLTEHTS